MSTFLKTSGPLAGTGPRTDARTGLPVKAQAGPPYRIPVRPLTTFYAADNPDGPNGAGFAGSCSDQEHEEDPKLIRFEIAAFIHQRLGKWLDEPWDSNGWMFKTDERGFGGDSARLFGYGTIQSDQIGKVKKVNVAYGTYGSIRRRRATRNGVAGWEYQSKRTLVRWETHTTSVREPGGGCWTKVRMKVSGNHPFTPGSPSIDFKTTTLFSKAGPDRVRVEVSGERDKYPFYEVRVPDANVVGALSRLRGQVYEYAPEDDFPGIINLSDVDSFSAPAVYVDAATDCCAKERIVKRSSEADQVAGTVLKTWFEPGE